MYAIHVDEGSKSHLDTCKKPKVCWSLYVKVGRVTQTIWKYHRFQDEVLRAVYTSDEEMNSNPIEELGTAFSAVGRSICDMILKEAKDVKDEFMVGKNEKEELKEWEEWWIENLRQ